MSSSTPLDEHVRPVASAGVLCFDEAGNALFVNPTYKPFWNLPGGRIEPGETPSQAAAREFREELGIDARVGSLLTVAWVAESGKERVLFIFEGGELSAEQQAAITVQESEISEFAFLSSDRLEPGVAPPELVGILHAALDARAAGITYREVGG